MPWVGGLEFQQRPEPSRQQRRGAGGCVDVGRWSFDKGEGGSSAGFGFLVIGIYGLTKSALF